MWREPLGRLGCKTFVDWKYSRSDEGSWAYGVLGSGFEARVGEGGGWLMVMLMSEGKVISSNTSNYVF